VPFDAGRDVLGHSRANATKTRKAAKRFSQGDQSVRRAEGRDSTDKLRSYVKPIKTLAADADHRATKGLNNAIEGITQAEPKREKIFFAAGSRSTSAAQSISIRSRSDQT